MIGRLNGTVLEKQPPDLLLDVQGVGYEIYAPMTTFYKLPAIGELAVVYTHFAVSENSQQLFGFAEKRDRQLFRTLIKVNGVGPKMAAAILSGMEADDVARCVMEDNVMALTKVPGVGKKTAERLVIELRDKLKDWQVPTLPLSELEAANSPAAAAPSHSLQDDAESALLALGYKPTEASKIVAATLKQHQVSSREELIRLSLKSLLPN